LEVRPSNLPAISLYRKTGFREVGRRPGYYDDTREDAIIMSLRLNPTRVVQG
jgi:ribosomal-protein-alanine N-acetyltransferase